MNFLSKLILISLLLGNSAMANDSLKHKINIVYAREPILKEKISNENIGEIAKGDSIKALHGRFNLKIHFPTGISTLDETSMNSLSSFAEYLKTNTKTNIAIIGFTDNVSVLELNQKLSESRAQSVANFLISKKVNTNQLKKIEGKNFMEPVGDNATPEGRAINRRVELVMLSNQEAALAKTNWTSSLKQNKDTLNTKLVPEVLKKLVTQLTEQKNGNSEVEIELDGLLVDDTKTKSGKDFYDLFYNNWEAPSAAKNYNITISEKPFRITTTMIVVTINDNIVYQTILQPRQDIIQSQTEEAIVATQDYLINYEAIMRQLNGDDMTGSGIY